MTKMIESMIAEENPPAVLLLVVVVEGEIIMVEIVNFVKI